MWSKPGGGAGVVASVREHCRPRVWLGWWAVLFREFRRWRAKTFVFVSPNSCIMLCSQCVGADVRVPKELTASYPLPSGIEGGSEHGRCIWVEE